MKNRKAGQSIIEFALVIIIFVFMLSLTFNAVLAFCTQQYLSYAAFMSARAYQAADATQNTQTTHALQTLAGYIPNLPSTVSGNLNLPLKLGSFRLKLATIQQVILPTNTNYGPAGGALGKGVEIRFTVPLVTVPLSGEISSQFGTVALTAFSYLGREISKDECDTFFLKFLQHFRISDVGSQYDAFSAHYYKNMDDNGC